MMLSDWKLGDIVKVANTEGRPDACLLAEDSDRGYRFAIPYGTVGVVIGHKATPHVKFSYDPIVRFDSEKGARAYVIPWINLISPDDSEYDRKKMNDIALASFGDQYDQLARAHFEEEKKMRVDANRNLQAEMMGLRAVLSANDELLQAQKEEIQRKDAEILKLQAALKDAGLRLNRNEREKLNARHGLKDSFGGKIEPYDFTNDIRTVRKFSLTPTKIIYNDPATIVFWTDGTKTVVKCKPGTEFSEYYGYLAAVAKKLYQTNGALERLITAKKVEQKLVKDISETEAPAKKKGKRMTQVMDEKKDFEKSAKAIETVMKGAKKSAGLADPNS